MGSHFWTNLDWHATLLSLFWAALFYAGLTFLQRFLNRIRFFKHFSTSLNLLFLFLALLLFLAEPLGRLHPYVLSTIWAAVLFFLVYIGIRLLDVFLLDLVVRWRKRAPVPIVLRDIGRWLLSLLILFFIIKVVFPRVNLNIFAVSSIVIGYIVGNATQDTLGNLIAGLALNTERPFTIGDWVTIGAHTGEVIDMTWRATRLHTKSNDCIVIPNGMIAKEPIVNYSQPSSSHAVVLQIGVDADAPPNKVRQVISEALKAVPDVLPSPSPAVRLVSYAESSTTYDMKFYINDFARLEEIQNRVLSIIWYYFKREGIVIPNPIREVTLRQVTREGEEASRNAEIEAIVKALSRIEIFHPLSKEELTATASNLREQIFASGEVLVRQGEEGDTFYIIRNGKVAVSVADDEGRSTVVAHLTKGAFFGEMSLLTGEKRTATITAEVDTKVLALSKAIFAEVLETNVQVAEALAKVLEKRQRENLEKMAKTKELSQDKLDETSSQTILRKIKSFFGLG
jgi:small-conductance mechanosensitive channel/CRP-like cAMP-binding protein